MKCVDNSSSVNYGCCVLEKKKFSIFLVKKIPSEHCYFSVTISKQGDVS